MEWTGIRVFLSYVRLIFESVPAPIFSLYKLIFFVFVVLSVVKVLSFKEGGN